jgi:hypothetical protein
MKQVKQSMSYAFWVCSAVILIGFGSCKKSSSNGTVISVPLFKVGTSLKPGNISGTIKGTFLADSVYNVTGDLVINKGDTVLAQQGAKIYFTGNYNVWVHGNLITLGTKADPVYFTVSSLTNAKTDVVGQDPTTDKAYAGTWGGIQVDSSAKFVIIKWTHIEFGGGKIATSQVFGVKNNATAWLISFASPNGIFVLEDSWLYGGVDDPIRIQGGKIHIFRNTSEKGGFTGGEGIANIKSGTQGNVAYNMIIGPATNGVKPSNNGGRTQTNIIAYNNTIVNGGYRRFLYGGAGNSLGRGGSINYEEGAEGQIWNNLMVDCKFGLRIVGTGNYLGNALIVADTAHLTYGNNYNYGDSIALVNQFYPTPFLTKPVATNIPAPSTFLPTGYTLGSVYNAPSLVGLNDPKFVNYTLPISYTGTVDSKLSTISFVKGYDFHLQSGSPAIGKGNTSFTPLSVVPIDPKFGATELTPPGADIGAYQSNGTGNQH